MMKKSLVALAVIAASGMAMAQSSVTLYGVADGGIGKDPGIAQKARVTGGTDTTNNGASRVGFTGVEDLGNGNKVGFQFETGLRLADGATASGGSTPNAFWGRQANVFIGGGWGTIKAGRQLTVSHIVEGVYDLTGQANYSAIDRAFGAAGSGNRADSALAYVSPNMGGFQAAVAYVSKYNVGLHFDPAGQEVRTANDLVGGNIWDAGVWYNNGGLGVGLSANKLGKAKTQYQVGGKYDFGNFAVAASYHRNNGVLTAAERGFSLSGQAKFGAFTATLSAARVTKPTKYTNYVLEGKYALSKRTFLYADVVNDGNKVMTATGLKKKKTGFGVGIHHSF